MSSPKILRTELDIRYPGAYDLDIGANEIVVLTVVHDSFAGLSPEGRIDLVRPFIEDAGLTPGVVDLYTPDEARDRGVVVANSTSNPVSWDDAINYVASGRKTKSGGGSRSFRRIVFYSYKGGVGRTTALVHTAFHLARRGKRVVLVDMDVEAPGLHLVLPPPEGKNVEAGLVDYLWERQVRPFSIADGSVLQTCLVDVVPGNAQAIAYAYEEAEGDRAQVHVIPAGVANSNYVRRLSTLSAQEVLTRADDAWSLFEKELVEQLDPDLVLIDARTGLGDWGGLSLLRLADEVFLVMFPSQQNIEGIRFVRNILRELGDIKTHIVVSPIPEGPIGKEIVSRSMPEILVDDEEAYVEVFYSPGVSSAARYPVESSMSAYSRIAALVGESETEVRLERSIQLADRWSIIESLRFPERDAKTIAAQDFESFFQKTSDFDKFLDDARWVVRGRKGTGKSTLFHLFVEHRENAARRAKGRLEGIDIVAGHGPTASAMLRPTTDEFASIQRGLQKDGYDWLSLWRAYAIVRLYKLKYESLLLALKRPEVELLAAHLGGNFPDGSRSWRSSQTSALLAMVGDPLNGLCRDVFSDVNSSLAKSRRKLWLLYDDLDQDIKEESPWQGEALGGLLRLAYDSNNQELNNIRFKVFLREDIWSKLVFTNKSHFGEPRTVLLQWRIDDFLRLAYRLAVGGSTEFRELVQREISLSDLEVDSAAEEELQRALAPLWGLSQEKGKKSLAAKWVYSRMTDARDNTYPRSLTVLLNSAKEEELRLRSKTPPPDRLFSPRAMQSGLKNASVERVNALKNEYPLLVRFLEDVEKNGSLRSQFSTADLRAVWQGTSTTEFSSFESFVAQLEEAGLLVRKRGTAYDYGFASLYIDGLSVTRVQGEKK
jgi:MinD-like ATPase involved in chromosome partitioning or flagellar assembly